MRRIGAAGDEPATVPRRLPARRPARSGAPDPDQAVRNAERPAATDEWATVTRSLPAPQPARSGAPDPDQAVRNAGRPAAAGTDTVTAARTSRRHYLRLLLGGIVAAVLVIEAALLAPTLSGVLTRLHSADPLWIAVAVGAAGISMGFFARMRRRLLAAAGVRVRQRDALAAAYVANSVHVTLPGGAAFSTAWTYRWMRARGASGPVITWTLVAGGVLSTLALAALGLVGSLLAGHGSGLGGLLPDAVVVGLVIAGVAVLRRRPDILVTAGQHIAGWADRLLRRPAGRSRQAVDDLVAQVATVRPRPADWLAAAAFALANWAFDAGCLAASAAALGVQGLSVSHLLLTYTAGMAAASLSLLPAGIGLVDGAMVLVLTAGGVPAATALPVVLLYRLISVGGTAAMGWFVALTRSYVSPPPDGPASDPVPLRDHPREFALSPAG